MGFATDDTTKRHKTHSTDLEVHYPWHPWFGLKVTTNRSCRRQGVACIQSRLEQNGRLLLLEFPGWMFDRGDLRSDVIGVSSYCRHQTFAGAQRPAHI